MSAITPLEPVITGEPEAEPSLQEETVDNDSKKAGAVDDIKKGENNGEQRLLFPIEK